MPLVPEVPLVRHGRGVAARMRYGADAARAVGGCTVRDAGGCTVRDVGAGPAALSLARNLAAITRASVSLAYGLDRAAVGRHARGSRSEYSSVTTAAEPIDRP